jgi:hypothetical protein
MKWLASLRVQASIGAAVAVMRFEDHPNLLVYVPPTSIDIGAVQVELMGTKCVERKVNNVDHQRHPNTTPPVIVEIHTDALEVDDSQCIREATQQAVRTAGPVRRLDNEVNAVVIGKLLAVSFQRSA